MSCAKLQLTQTKDSGEKGIAYFQYKEDCVRLIVVLDAHRKHI